jgi:hypothetical protein
MIKSSIRYLYYRFSTIRFITGLIYKILGKTASIHLSHFFSFNESNALGPVQRDEAITLFGIIRTIRPKVILEFGFFHGHSAFNFLSALDNDGFLYSYDISDESNKRAKTEFSCFKNFKFIHKSQTDFDHSDIAHNAIDFVFFDAAHDLQLNIETFNKVLPHITDNCIIAIHDTGLWFKSYFEQAHITWSQNHPADWVTDSLFAHQPDERRFVNWITSEYPQYQAIHLHSSHTLRHGLTIIQKREQLTGTTHQNSIKD